MDLGHAVAELPLWVAYVVIVGLTSLVAASVPLLVRRLVPLERLRLNNEVAGFKYATLGVIYAVVVAFIVVLVWEDFTDAEQSVQREADALAVLFHLAQGFDRPVSDNVRNALQDYAQDVIDREWEAMGRGAADAYRHAPIATLYNIYMSIDPASARLAAILAESMDMLAQLSEARLDRLLAADSQVPGVVWGVMLVGGVVVIGFTLFFGAPNVWVQAAMTGLITLIIALVLVTAAVLDYPYTGEVSVRPAAFERVLRMMQNADQG